MGVWSAALKGQRPPSAVEQLGARHVRPSGCVPEPLLYTAEALTHVVRERVDARVQIADTRLDALHADGQMRDVVAHRDHVAGNCGKRVLDTCFEVLHSHRERAQLLVRGDEPFAHLETERFDGAFMAVRPVLQDADATLESGEPVLDGGEPVLDGGEPVLDGGEPDIDPLQLLLDQAEVFLEEGTCLCIHGHNLQASRPKFHGWLGRLCRQGVAGAVPPSYDPAMNPSDLRVVQAEPLNAESPLRALAERVTPLESFFVRSNFAVPQIDAARWSLNVDGLVQRPRTIGLDELTSLGETTITSVMECAGNGRRLMSPVPAGTPWELGAVSTGAFTGVPLARLLELCERLGEAIDALRESAGVSLTSTARESSGGGD